jgi:serine/threonine protein kinase
MNCPNCQNLLRDTARFCTSCGLLITGERGARSDNSQFYRTSYDPASEATVVRSDRLIGRILEAKYELLARIGEGGMGTVYRARRVHIGDEVAVKVLHSKYVAEEDGIERFRREARAAAMLHHKNAVVIHDYGESPTESAAAFIVMELVNGSSLRQLLRRVGRLSIEYAVALMSEICAGVAAAHRQNIIHRDLKPDNILVLPPEDGEGYGTAKVVDFGIAKLRDLAASHMLTLTGDIIGSPYYMSPEQCQGEALDARSDVYSLAAMMYEMLAGVRPFTSHTPTAVIAKQLTEPPPPFPENLGIPAALEATIMRALAKNPQARPADAASFSREMRASLSLLAPVPGERKNSNGERIEVFIGQGVNDDYHNPTANNGAALTKSSLKAPLVAFLLIILLVVGGGAFALLKLRNLSANDQAPVSNLNQKKVPPADSTGAKPSVINPLNTVTIANNNRPPTVVSTAKDSTVQNPDKGITVGRGQNPENGKTASPETAKDRGEQANTLTANVTGDWQSFYGAVRLSQAGSSITGTIWYADGSGTGRISGSINGRTLTFRWVDTTSTYNGAGAVALSKDGRLLKGRLRLNGTTQPLELRR